MDILPKNFLLNSTSALTFLPSRTLIIGTKGWKKFRGFLKTSLEHENLEPLSRESSQIRSKIYEFHPWIHILKVQKANKIQISFSTLYINLTSGLKFAVQIHDSAFTFNNIRINKVPDDVISFHTFFRFFSRVYHAMCFALKRKYFHRKENFPQHFPTLTLENAF